jgi:hypothetical protein
MGTLFIHLLIHREDRLRVRLLNAVMEHTALASIDKGRVRITVVSLTGSLKSLDQCPETSGYR